MSTLTPDEIRRRALELRKLASPCVLCPHECAVDRPAGERGRCGMGMGAVLCASVPHFGEEPEVAGSRGSGAMFFGSCNLRCAYCQNAQISQSREVRRRSPTPAGTIAKAMLELQDRGCHNVNLVTPTHVTPFAVEALAEAVEGGLDLPVVYNTSSYDSVRALKLLEGVVDVYLADLRYSDDVTAAELSRAPGYVAASRRAVLEMARQVGTDNAHGPDGTVTRGLIVRLLVLPNDLAGTRRTLEFLRDEVGTSVRLALMSQYFPAHRAREEALLSRSVHHGEYLRVIEVAEAMGFDNALVQHFEANDFYRPDFDRDGEPFADAGAFATAPARSSTS